MRMCMLQAFGEALGVERCVHFRIVVEVNEDIASALRKARALSLRSCFFASQAASLVSRGSNSKNSTNFVSFHRKLGGNCHRIGPSLWRKASTPEAKKFANGAFVSRNRFMWVM